MAGTDKTSAPTPFPTSSYETALCIVPSKHQCEHIDKLRSLYDKAYGKWPPHINLIYPFVSPEFLSQAKERIQSNLDRTFGESGLPTLILDRAGHFKHHNCSTVFLRGTNDADESILMTLRSAALQALGFDASPCNFHLTIGQTEDGTDSARQFLLSKASLLPAFQLETGSLAILVREKTEANADVTSQMRLWGSIDVSNNCQVPLNLRSEFWIKHQASAKELPVSNDEMNSATAQPGSTYTFKPETQIWCPVALGSEAPRPSTLSISSYNILIDSEYPPAHNRDALLVDTILAKFALADILILQEVSDDFLSYFLHVDEVQHLYPYTSHGPPSQPDVGPLPSLRNVVIFSKWYFKWEFIPFHRRHKGAVVASFDSLRKDGGSEELPLVVAGVHLTCGLTDGSVAAKKVQLQTLVHHLQKQYTENPWLIAGDFNLTTSRHTINEAVKNKSISQNTSYVLESIDWMLSENGLLDAWTAARVEGVDETVLLDADDLFEGEEGSTFNPRENALAAATSGTSLNRPQRYDRILMRSRGHFNVSHFNHFGYPEPIDGITRVASDHTGIRALFAVKPGSAEKKMTSTDILHRYTIQQQHITAELSNTTDLVEALNKRGVFPTAQDEDRYKDAFALIKEVFLPTANDDINTAEVPMVILPVGSYALNVWTPESDIDCLCIGSISSKTFFQLARQRIYRSESKGVRLLRKVEANTGTMLELSVNGVTMDLQYCPAGNVVQRWSEFASLPPTDPIFNLSILSLRKLKPIRDLSYIQRSVPSTTAFRLAYHSIKRWAVERGVYSAKFGYLGGIHITLMLSWVCKRLVHETGSVSAGDLILTFFHHYANFDWQNDIVFDAFFHKKKPRYQRSAREPMVILGFHAPNSNIAHTSTIPGLQVLVEEFRRAEKRLSVAGMTWDGFFCTSEPAITISTATKGFLTSFESYVKIDIQFWGRALSKGKGLVGWVESRSIGLVVDMHKALPNLSMRIWPARFVDSEANAADSYYHGSYLIGLSQSSHTGASFSREDRSEAKSALQKTFDKFLSQVKADDKYYDETSSWIGISLVKPSDVKDLQVDEREWGDYTTDMESISDDEEELDDLDEDLPAPSTTRKLPVRSAPAATTTPVSSNKLRPASDVLNRLRWDSNLDPSEYIVGYEDRFLGAKETSLEKWKTEQTDEEFIPQHRILYFKKKGEDGGGVMWERATRIDKIFGSGLGGGS